MKTVTLILGLFLFVSSGFAQKRSDFQGPKFKNYKYWKHNTPPTPIFTSDQKKELTGPAYKNYKSWRDTKKITKKKVITSGTNERQKLTGPKYKNYKPWKKKQTSLVW